METSGPNPVTTAIAALTGKAVNAIEKKKGSILGMHETFLKHQLNHEDFLKRTAIAHHLAEPGSEITLNAGNGVTAKYKKAGGAPAATPKKPTVKKPAKPTAKPAKPATTKKTATNPGMTTTVPVKTSRTRTAPTTGSAGDFKGARRTQQRAARRK